MNEKIKCVNNNCSDCQEWLKEKLAECEDWEEKRKESYRKFELRFCHNQDNRQDDEKNQNWYVETGGYFYTTEQCPSCQAITKIIKSNSHGDQTEELKEHAHTANCQQSHSSSISQRESSLSNKHTQNRERERESNTGKPKNYLPWILGGAGIFALIGAIVYFLTRKENK